MYRNPPIEARYICTACFQSASSAAGDCKACGVPRRPLADATVRDELRQYADARLAKRAARETTVIWTLAAAVGLAIYVPYAVHLYNTDNTITHRRHGLAALLIAVLGVAFAWLHAHLFKGSARATMAARRLRISRELGQDVQLVGDLDDSKIAQTAGVDPSVLPIPALLTWLEVHVED